MLFNFCHLKKLVIPETFGPYYVYIYIYTHTHTSTFFYHITRHQIPKNGTSVAQVLYFDVPPNSLKIGLVFDPRSHV